MQTYKNKNDFIVLGFLLLLIAPYFILSFFSHPIADDYCNAHTSIDLNLLEAYKNVYLSWSGRYTTNLLVLLNPITFNWFTGYQLIPVILIVVTFFSIYFFIDAITNKNIHGIKLILISLFVTLLYLFQMPTIAEGIYWYTGAITYQLANALALFHITSIIHFFNKRYFINKTVHIVLSSALLVIVIGFNETIMLIMLSFYLILFIRAKSIKSNNQLIFGFLLFISISASLVSILSPGNIVRLSYFPDNQNLIKSSFFTFLQVFRFFFHWISNLPFIILSILFVPICLQLNRRVKIFYEHFYLHPFWFSSFLFVLLFLCIFPAYWSTNILGQHRTMNTAYFFFILIWFINISIWINHYSETKIFQFVSNISKWYNILIFFVLFSMAITQNGYHAFLDIFYGKAMAFDKEMKNRYEMLEKARTNNIEKVKFKPLQNKPHTLFVSDITSNPKNWINSCQANYFGIKEISLETNN